MAEPRESWKQLLRQTTDYLAILREGGFGYVEGNVKMDLARTGSQAPGKVRAPGGAIPSTLPSETQEMLKAAMADPFAHLVARPGKVGPAPQKPAVVSPPARSTPPAPARPPFAPAASSLPPLTAQPPSGKSKQVTVSDRAEAAKLIAACNDLDRVRQLISGCRLCGLWGGRTLTVPGEGNPQAELMFVGEGPGYHEDVQGKPFVGRAGALLTQMIEAMGFRRDQVYITNIVKCRPPGNRDPEPDEIKACEPFLKRQIELIRPKVICALGRISIQGLLRDTTPISKVRGKWRTYQGIPLMPTFHPAFLLRDPSQKRPAWEDLRAIMAKIAESKKST